MCPLTVSQCVASQVSQIPATILTPAYERSWIHACIHPQVYQHQASCFKCMRGPRLPGLIKCILLCVHKLYIFNIHCTLCVFLDMLRSIFSTLSKMKLNHSLHTNVSWWMFYIDVMYFLDIRTYIWTRIKSLVPNLTLHWPYGLPVGKMYSGSSLLLLHWRIQWLCYSGDSNQEFYMLTNHLRHRYSNTLSLEPNDIIVPNY